MCFLDVAIIHHLRNDAGKFWGGVEAAEVKVEVEVEVKNKKKRENWLRKGGSLKNVTEGWAGQKKAPAVFDAFCSTTPK